MILFLRALPCRNKSLFCFCGLEFFVSASGVLLHKQSELVFGIFLAQFLVGFLLVCPFPLLENVMKLLVDDFAAYVSKIDI